MATSIKMPDLGTTVDQIKLVAWLVKEGDAVRRGDRLAEIETDKAASQLESIAEGTVLKIMVADGTLVNTGQMLALIGQPGEPLPALENQAQPPEVSLPAGMPALPVAPLRIGRPAVPLVVRNLAMRLGVDLAQVNGTGPNGMITREDIQRAAPAPAVERTQPSPAQPLPPAQRAVARAVGKSHRELVPLHLTAVMDMTAAAKRRAESAAAGMKISYDALFIKALAAGIRQWPMVAARLESDRVVYPVEIHTAIHIALAIGLDNELYLPVIRSVNQKPLAAVQAEIETLAGHVKAHTLKPEQMTGGCMALSNLGMYPIETFEAVIFPEHSAILAVGAIQNRPAVVEERVVIRPMATVNLAVDHRLINGRLAAQFLTSVKQSVEGGVFD